MSDPAKSVSPSPNRLISGITFGLASALGFFPLFANKILKNPSVSVASEKLAPWALVGTAFFAFILRDRDIRQIGRMSGSIGKIEQAAKELQQKLEAKDSEISVLKKAAEGSKAEFGRLQKVEEDYKKLLLELTKQCFSLFELTGDDPLSDEALQDNLNGYVEVLPENLKNFKSFLTDLKSDADAFLPPQQWKDDVKLFMKELSEKMGNSSKEEPITLLAGGEKTRMVAAIKSIYDIFTILGDQPVALEEVADNLHGFVEVLPESVNAFKTLVQELKNKVDAASVTDEQFRKDVRTSVGKTTSRNSTPTRPNDALAKQLVFSPSSTTPLTKTNQSSQQ